MHYSEPVSGGSSTGARGSDAVVRIPCLGFSDPNWPEVNYIFGRSSFRSVSASCWSKLHLHAGTTISGAGTMLTPAEYVRFQEGPQAQNTAIQKDGLAVFLDA